MSTWWGRKSSSSLSEASRSSLHEGKSSFDTAIQVTLGKKFRSFCKVVPIKCHCWITSLGATSNYAPIQLGENGGVGGAAETEVRMRVAGVALSSGQSVSIFDCELGTNLSTIEGKRGEIPTSICLSDPPMGSKLSPLIICGTQKGRLIIRDLQSRDVLFEAITKQKHPGPIRLVAIHDAGTEKKTEDYSEEYSFAPPVPSIIILACESKVHVWDLDLESKVSVLSDHSRPVTAISLCIQTTAVFEHTLSFIVTASSDSIVLVYDVRTFALCFTLYDHTGPVNCLASIAQPTPLVISGSSDQSIKIWNLNTGLEVRTLHGHTDAVFTLAVIPTERRGLVSGGADMMLRIWDLDSGQQIANYIAHSDVIRCVAVTLTPRLMIISGGYDDLVKIWDLDSSTDTSISSVTAILGNTRINDNDKEENDDDDDYGSKGSYEADHNDSSRSRHESNFKNDAPKKSNIRARKVENARRVNFEKSEISTEKSVFSREFSMEDFEGKPGGALL